MGKLVERIARLMAILGGGVLVLLIILTCLSVLGREINQFAHSSFLSAALPSLSTFLIGAGVGPIDGDYELVEAGITFAIFAFLPICQLYSAHASVDIFTSALSVKTNKYIKAFWEIILCAVLIIITWRLYVGMLSKMSYGETTFLLQFPIWWSYALSLFAAIIASTTSIYCALARVAEIIWGKDILPQTEGTLG